MFQTSVRYWKLLGTIYCMLSGGRNSAKVEVRKKNLEQGNFFTGLVVCMVAFDSLSNFNAFWMCSLSFVNFKFWQYFGNVCVTFSAVKDCYSAERFKLFPRSRGFLHLVRRNSFWCTSDDQVWSSFGFHTWRHCPIKDELSRKLCVLPVQSKRYICCFEETRY